MKFKTEKLIFTKLPIKEVLNNSKQFLKNITNRRTVRDFSNREIDLKIIENAISSAGSAPNGANLQPWHFVIIRDKKIKKRISE